MNEEDIIKLQFGNRTPFKVPEGYFDNLAANIMQNLPEKPAAREIPIRTFWSKKRIYAAAASIAVLIVGTGALLWNHSDKMTASPSIASSQTQQIMQADFSSSIEQMADYAMLDNEDYYVYLADN
jgi:hypothetical protein